MTQENVTLIISSFIIPLLPILTAYIIALLKKKTLELETKINNDNINQYIDILDDAVYSVVTSLSETTVKKLKTSGEFNEDVGKEILKEAKLQIFDIIGETGATLLKEVYNDLDTLLTNKIESAVKSTK